MSRIRSLFIIFIALIMVLCSLNAFAEPNNYDPLSGFVLMYGDATLDGEVTTADVHSMLKYCSGELYFNAMQCINGDVNCDTVVNTADVSLILRHIVGLIKSLPYTPVNNKPDHAFTFQNYSFPKNNQRLSYGRSYSLDATITSEYALKMIRIRILDNRDGTVEIDKSITFDSNEYVIRYNTKTSENAIDNLIRFSSLSTGEKKLELYCSNLYEENVLLFASYFRIGFTYGEVAGHVYNRSDESSSSEARKILALLNSLDVTNDEGVQIISTGLSHLGENYAAMDCSRFVQTTINESTGVQLPRISVDQAIYCKEKEYLVDINSMRAGDLVFMSRTYCDCGRYHEVHHVALYIGEYDGTDYIIESTSSLDGVVIRRIWGLVSGNWVIDSVARIRR